MDCNVLKPLPEFSQLSTMHYIELDRDMSNVAPHCEECANSEHHQQITNEVYPDNPSDNSGLCKSNQKQKNPLVWGDDILFLDQQHDSVPNEVAGTSCFSRSSDARDDENKVTLRQLQNGNDRQGNNKLELAVNNMVSLSEMSELGVVMETEKFINLPGFSFFPKDEESEDLNEICSSLQIGGMSENHPCSVEDINRNSITVTPVPEDPPSGRTGLRRTRNASRRLSVVNGDDSYICQPESADSSIRKRNMSEHSIISAGSYDDPDSPYNSSGRRKRRRYEEEPSDDPAFEKSRKNAIIAKRNREKKKQMMEQMESRCDKLSSQNELLDSDNIKLRHRVQILEEEVFYLKSVLANDSALSTVLSNLKHVDHLRLSSSFEASKFNKKPGSSRFASGPSNGQLKGGICLHVIDGNSVSMELCAKCAQMASGSSRSNDGGSGKMMPNKRSA